MADFTITDFRYIKRSGVGIGGAWQKKPLWVAMVKMGDLVLVVSRYDTEKTWYADSAFGKGCMPIFCHGEGSRCCMKRPVNEDVHKALQALYDAHNKEPEQVFGL